MNARLREIIYRRTRRSANPNGARLLPLPAAVAAVVLGGLAAGVFFVGCSRSTPQPAEQAAGTPSTRSVKPAAEPGPSAQETASQQTPVSKPIGFKALDDVVLDPGGKAVVEVQITRNGNEGPIEVRLETAPPEKVTVNLPSIAEGESTGSLEISADPELGEKQLSETLLLTATVGRQSATQKLELTVKKLTLPAFQPVSQQTLSPGVTATATIAIQRNGFEGPLELKVEGVPEKVTAKAVPIPAGEDETELEITSAADAPDMKKSLTLSATHLGRTISLEVPIQVVSRPYEVQSFKVVTIAPGETQRVPIPVVRRSYQGAVELEAQELPAGVTAAKAQVAAGQTAGELVITAAADAKERVRSVKVASRAGAIQRVDPMVVRVSRGEGGFLPREVTADPELSSSLLRRGSFGGRLSGKSKAALLDAYGGTQESEEAVALGLVWLAAHQQADGSWFLHNYGENHPKCDCFDPEFEEGVENLDVAATGFALLPMLGAGITHADVPKGQPKLEPFKKVVERGLGYLIRVQNQNNQAAKDAKKTGMLDAKLYSHVIGTMALCEAYGLSGDERLKQPAQMAVRYLVNAQHPSGGGWRYGYQQAGDMSATAWMFLAIRTAQLAGMQIEKSPLTRAERFIDSCAAGPSDARFSQYSYLPDTPPAKLTLSAAGLLSREYLGWKQENPDLVAGAKYLMEHMPPESAEKLGTIYYYYYATQVLHHLEGSDFDLWNHRMREHLVRTQSKEGHQTGSWDPNGTDWGNRGGRIYATSMALITLEVYYRHLPMYRPVLRSGDTSSLQD